MTRTACSLLIATVLLVGIGSLAWGQAPTFDLDWDNSTLSAALEQLGRAFGVQYTLPADLGAKKLTVHRKGVTLPEAMQELAKAAGVRVLADPSGKFVFQPTQAAAGTQTAGWQQNQPANPWATPGAAYGGAPAPVRPGQPVGVAPTMPAAPGLGGGMPGMGGFGAAGGQAGAFGGRVTLPNGQTGIMTMGGEVVDPSEVALRILELQHMSPELVAMLFGGYPVYDMGSGGGGGGGGGYGGGGNSGYGGNSSGYGNNTGSGSNSRGSRNSNNNSGNNTGNTSRSSSRSNY